MTKKLTAVLGLLVVLAMLVGACAAPAAAPAPAPADEAAATATEAAEGAATEAAATEAAAPTGELFRIALIMPSTTTDYSWSQSIYDGLKKVQEEMGGEGALEIAVTENMFQVADAGERHSRLRHRRLRPGDRPRRPVRHAAVRGGQGLPRHLVCLGHHHEYRIRRRADQRIRL